MSRYNKEADLVDKRVGAKLLELRLGHGLSRNKLGSLVGITGEQLRKYEVGLNRVSSGRLFLLASTLNEDISSFFEEVNTENRTSKTRAILEIVNRLSQFDDDMVYAFNQHSRNIKSAIDAMFRQELMGASTSDVL